MSQSTICERRGDGEESGLWGRREQGTRVETPGAGHANSDAQLGLPGGPEEETGDLAVRRHGVRVLPNTWLVHMLPLKPVSISGSASLDRQPETHQVGSP